MLEGSKLSAASCVPVLLIVALLTACPAHQAGGPDNYDRNRDRRGGGSRYGGGYGNSSAPVLVNLQRLRDAVVETSTSGVPRNNVDRLRRTYCEERESDPVIFFQLVVSTHWHYYWICSDRRPHRASTPEGVTRLKHWLAGFRTQASNESSGCSRAVRTPILQGTHESGIRAVAHCDGTLVLNFPDGGRSNRTYNARSSAGSYTRPPTSGGTCPTCPQCPQCPAPGSGRCPVCPQCQQCPQCPRCKICPQCRCPKPPPCPKCPPPDCTKQALAAGRKGFKQGVVKACRRICRKIYSKCRSIDPKTAMCHVLQEYCGLNCAK